MNKRLYKTLPKKTVAGAFGFRKCETLNSRIEERLDKAPQDVVEKIGDWKNRKKLLPEQIKMIIYLLGEPEDPNSLYIEI